MGQQQPKKVGASSLLRCSVWILGCGSAEWRFQCPPESDRHRWGLASCKMQHLAFCPGHLAGSRKYSAPYLRAANYTTEYKNKIWVGSPTTQTSRPCFLFAFPPLTDFAKFAGQGPTCNMRGSAFVLRMCALTYLTRFLVMRTLSLKLARLSISFLSIFCMIFAEISKKSRITKLLSPVFLGSSHLLLFISSPDISPFLLIKQLLS